MTLFGAALLTFIVNDSMVIHRINGGGTYQLDNDCTKHAFNTFFCVMEEAKLYYMLSYIRATFTTFVDERELSKSNDLPNVIFSFRMSSKYCV